MEAVITDGRVDSVSGAKCKRGIDYANQEILDPKRNIASSVKVNGGELPLVSVRLTGLIPKNRIFDAIEEIKKLEVDAPVKVGQILINNVFGLRVDLIATKNIAKK